MIPLSTHYLPLSFVVGNRWFKRDAPPHLPADRRVWVYHWWAEEEEPDGCLFLVPLEVPYEQSQEEALARLENHKASVLDKLILHQRDSKEYHDKYPLYWNADDPTET